jgi:hypothetical protein
MMNRLTRNKAALAAITVALIATSAACAEIKRDEPVHLEVTTVMGFVACQAETGHSCLKLRVRNVGAKRASIALDQIGRVPVAARPAFEIEGRRSDGQWERIARSIGTYDVPTEFLLIRPGSEKDLVVMAADYRKHFPAYSDYRVLLRVNESEEVYSGALDLGPRSKLPVAD